MDAQPLVPCAGGAKPVAMIVSPHILLLAGSSEAQHIAQSLSARGLSYDVWLSEAPRGPTQMPHTPQLRRFDSAGAMQQAIAQGRYSALLDAAHAFDRTGTAQAVTAARALGLPYMRVERPLWLVHGHPLWQLAPDVHTACAMIGPKARVFATTGWESLPEFNAFSGEVLFLRQTRKHARPAPYPFVELAFGDAPFSVQDEQELFRVQRIDTLICRNLGGLASRPKLDAALALGLRVILIDRPLLSVGLPMVATVQDAMDWVQSI